MARVNKRKATRPSPTSEPQRQSKRLQRLRPETPSDDHSNNEYERADSDDEQVIVDTLNEAAGKADAPAAKEASHEEDSDGHDVLSSPHRGRGRPKKTPTKGKGRPPKFPPLDNKAISATWEAAQSSKLRKVPKKVRANITAPRSGNVWVLSDAEEPPKIRKLNQRKQANPSPFKNQGVIGLNSASVDLDDHDGTAEATHENTPQTRAPSSRQDGGDRSRNRTKPPTKRRRKQAQADVAEEVAVKVNKASSQSMFVEQNGGDEASYNDTAAGTATAAEAVDEEDEDEDEDENTVKARLISGIEDAVAVHECKESWSNMFLVGEDIEKDNRSAHRRTPESDIGVTALQAIENTMRLWEARDIDMRWISQAMNETMDSVSNIIPTKRSESEDEKRVHDLYQWIIPGFVRLLRTIVQQTPPTESMEYDECEPLLQALESLWKVSQKAMKWQPRPSANSLGSEVLSRTRGRIAMGAKDILQKYAAHYNDLTAQEEAVRAQEREEQRVRAANARERSYKIELRQRLQEVRDRNRQRAEASLRRMRLASQPRLIIDIDDITDEEEQPQQQQQQHEQEREATQQQPPEPEATQQQQPKPEAAQQQEISEALTADEAFYLADGWEPEEEAALLNGLQRYTDGDRFHQILDEYGEKELLSREKHELRKHAVDIVRKLMEQNYVLPDYLTSVLPVE